MCMLILRIHTYSIYNFKYQICVCIYQSQGLIEEERRRVNASIVSLEEELDGCRDQGEQWKNLLEASTEELDSTKQE